MIQSAQLFGHYRIILDVMAKNDRKAFIIDANQFAMMRRQK